MKKHLVFYSWWIEYIENILAFTSGSFQVQGIDALL